MRHKELVMRELAETKPAKPVDAPESVAWLKEKLTLEVLLDLRDAVTALQSEKK